LWWKAILTDWSVRNSVSEGNRFLRDPSPPRKRRKEARPDEIIEAARAVFLERGFALAKVDEIARRAGASKGTVYLYFPTKEALFEAVMRVNVLSVIEGAAAAITADDRTPAAVQLRLVLETFYREFVSTDRKKLMHLMIAEGPHFPALLDFYHRDVVSRGMFLLTQLIERGIRRGEFDPPEGLVRYPKLILGPALMAALYGNLFGDRDPIDIADYSRAHIASIMRMLGVRDTEERRG
jgi:AcrR family transcriptional regulator